MKALSAAVVLMLAGSAVLADETVTYTYDARGRLVKVEYSDTVTNNLGTRNDGVTTEYQYDDADNRTQKKTTGA